MLLTMSNWYNTVTIYEFEGVYDPTYLNLDINDWDSWKIYANKVSNLMAKILDVKKTNLNLKDVNDFTQLYNDEVKRLEQIDI